MSPVPGGATSAQLIESNHNIHSVTFNGIVSSPRSSTVGGYGVGGIGYYHRTVQLTSPAGRVRHGLRSVLVLVLSGGGVG